MHLRKQLITDNWVQLGAVVAVVLLANVAASKYFSRLDLTGDHIYTLSEASREIASNLERPLFVKVYFTSGLESPYNNHQEILVDKLEEFRAFSKGKMEISVVDPTHLKELEEEALRFGIQPIQYRYRGSDRAELKRVFMGASFVYGEKQAALSAVTQLGSLEYDIAGTIQNLIENEDRPTIGFTSGSSEVDVVSASSGPLKDLYEKIASRYNVLVVPLGGDQGVPEEVDALLMLGPQAQVKSRARYQIDQYLMTGGSVSVFLTNTRPNMRYLRPEEIFTTMESFLGHHGVLLNRDLVVDRSQNGMMRVPVQQGNKVGMVPVNHPIIPKVTSLSQNSLIVKGLDQLLFPFASSLTVLDPLPVGVQAEVLAKLSPEGGRIQGVKTLDPNAFIKRAPGEEQGQWPVMVALTGTFHSAFRGQPIPPGPSELQEDPASMITEGVPARLVVASSADVVANNTTLMLNLIDWMCQDEALIGIRTKSVQIPPLELPSTGALRWIKAINFLSGILILALVGIWRLLARKAGRKA